MRKPMTAGGGADTSPVEKEDVPAEQEHLADQAPGRTMADAEALRNSATLLRLVSPEMAIHDPTLTRGEYMCVPDECVGVSPAVLEMNLHTVEYGRFFTDIDEENANAVCVIGTGLRDQLFGAPEKVGRAIIPIGEI